MGDRVISFADVIGDEREFFRRYFNKRIFYRPGGITGDPRQILSIAVMVGKTLIHGGLNLTRPNLRALARSMTDRFAAKSEVVTFLTPAGQQGAAHSDPTDVYVVQLEGTKRWQIWPTPEVRRPGDDKQFPSLPDPVFDLSLEPGDVLYIPYGTPHRAAAEGRLSLHLTVVAGSCDSGP